MALEDTRAAHYIVAENLIKQCTNVEQGILITQAAMSVAIAHAILATAPDSLFQEKQAVWPRGTPV